MSTIEYDILEELKDSMESKSYLIIKESLHLFTVKQRGGQSYLYNPKSKKFLAPSDNSTKLWVTNPRPSTKGQSVGKAIGKAKGKAKGKSVNKKIKRTVNHNKYEYYDFSSDPIISKAIEEFAGDNISRFEAISSLLTKLHQKTLNYYEKSDETKKVYFSVSDADLLCGSHYKAILKVLEAHGIIKITYETSSDKKKIHPYSVIHVLKVPRIGYKRHKLTCDKWIDKRKAWLSFSRRNMSDIDIALFNKVIGKSLTIDISEEEFRSGIRSRYFDSYKFKRDSGKITEDRTLSEHREALKEYTKSDMGRFYKIEAFNNDNYYSRIDSTKVDKFGLRLHHPLTNLHKSLRYYAKIDGVPLTHEFDLKQSQPTILANILRNNPDYPSDDCEFIKSVNKLRVYEDFAEKNNQSIKLAKLNVIQSLFGDVYGESHSNFQKTYPTAGLYIAMIKSERRDRQLYNYDKEIKRKANLAMDLQRAESSIFRRVWGELLFMDIKFIPIHDSILCTEKDSVVVYNTIVRILEEELSVNFEITKKGE